MSEDIRTHRLFKEEADHLENYWNNKFSDFVHSSFKNDIELTKNNKKRNKFQKFAQNMVMLAVGAIFLFYTYNMDTFFGKLTTLLLGLLFVSWGGIDIYLGMKEKRKHA